LEVPSRDLYDGETIVVVAVIDLQAMLTDFQSAEWVNQVQHVTAVI